MGINLTPVLDYILVKKVDEQLPSGIVLAAPADPTAPRYAEVIATGPGRPSEYSGAMIEYSYQGFRTASPKGDGWVEIVSAAHAPSPVRVGWTILMHGGAGTKVKSGGEEYWAILPRDVIGVVGA